MEDTEFHHAPISNAEVARRQRRLRNKRRLAFGLMVSAIAVGATMLQWASLFGGNVEVADLPVVTQIGMLAVLLYVGVAGYGCAMWLCASFILADGIGPVDESIRFHRLDVDGTRALKKLCDECPRAQQIVSGWLSSGAVLRVRDLRFVRHLVAYVRATENRKRDAVDRETVLESLKTPSPLAG